MNMMTADGSGEPDTMNSEMISGQIWVLLTVWIFKKQISFRLKMHKEMGMPMAGSGMGFGPMMGGSGMGYGPMMGGPGMGPGMMMGRGMGWGNCPYTQGY